MTSPLVSFLIPAHPFETSRLEHCLRNLIDYSNNVDLFETIIKVDFDSPQSLVIAQQ
jgi:hypothetical protein